MNKRLYKKWLMFTLICLIACLSMAFSFSHLASKPHPISSLPQVITSPTPTVVVISQPTSYLDPSSIIAIVGLVIQFGSLLFVIKYVKDTAMMANATLISTEATKKSSEAAEKTLFEMQRTREEENAPFVVAYFNYVHSKFTLYLVVENIGKSIAKNVKLEFSPAISVSDFNQRDIDLNPLITEGIPSIVPNYKINIRFDFLMHYIKGNFPMEYRVEVMYYGQDGLTSYKTNYILDLEQYKHIDFQNEEPLTDINNNLSTIASNSSMSLEHFNSYYQKLNEISNALNRISTVGNDIYLARRPSNLLVILTYFILIWTIEYKKEEEMNKHFLYDIRKKCLAIEKEILIFIAINEVANDTELLLDIASKLYKLGNMKLSADGEVIAFSIRGHNIEDFNSLGDCIIDDIKKFVESAKNNPLLEIDKNGNEDIFYYD